MATGGVFQELAEDLQCKICNEDYNQVTKQPKVLPCNHVFCAECLGKCLRNDKLKCPFCRAVKVFDCNAGIGDLPQPLIITQMLDRIRNFMAGENNLMLYNSTNEGGAPLWRCGLCRGENNKALTFCQNCSRNLCESCTEKHSQHNVFRSHYLITISDRTLCKSHPNELIIAYCETCVKGVCTVCVHSDSHRSHNVLDMDDESLIERKTHKLMNYKQFVEQTNPRNDNPSEIVMARARLESKVIRFDDWLTTFTSTVDDCARNTVKKAKDGCATTENGIQPMTAQSTYESKLQILQNSLELVNQEMEMWQLEMEDTDVELQLGTVFKDLRVKHNKKPRSKTRTEPGMTHLQPSAPADPTAIATDITSQREEQLPPNEIRGGTPPPSYSEVMAAMRSEKSGSSIESVSSTTGDVTKGTTVWHREVWDL